jgi:hypothetical protein
MLNSIDNGLIRTPFPPEYLNVMGIGIREKEIIEFSLK